jgi:hypothetical protein
MIREVSDDVTRTLRAAKSISSRLQLTFGDICAIAEKTTTRNERFPEALARLDHLTQLDPEETSRFARVAESPLRTLQSIVGSLKAKHGIRVIIFIY